MRNRFHNKVASFFTFLQCRLHLYELVDDLNTAMFGVNILAMHVISAAKRLFGIPDFRYHALADGIKAILKCIGKGPLHPRGRASPPTPQMTLWPG